MGAVGPRELPDESRFPDARLAHDRNRLPAARGGALNPALAAVRSHVQDR
jgi:hypothetical protein